LQQHIPDVQRLLHRDDCSCYALKSGLRFPALPRQVSSPPVTTPEVGSSAHFEKQVCETEVSANINQPRMPPMEGDTPATRNSGLTFDRNDYAIIVELLRNHFESPHFRSLARQQLCDCKQNPAESARDFAERLKQIVKKVTRGQPRNTQCERLLDDYVDRLKPSLRFHVNAATPPPTSDEAVIKAVMYESLLADAANSLTIFQFSRHPTTPNSNVTCFCCGRVGHIQTFCRYRACSAPPLFSFPRVCTLSLVDHSPSAHIRITVNGVNVSALADTGSSITLAAQDLCAALGIFQLDPPSSLKAVGMAGTPVHLAGSKVVKMKIANIELFLIVHFTKGSCVPNIDSAYEVIIGNDVLAFLPTMTLDFKAKTVSFGSVSLPLGQRYPLLYSGNSVRRVVKNASEIYTDKDTVEPVLHPNFPEACVKEITPSDPTCLINLDVVDCENSSTSTRMLPRVISTTSVAAPREGTYFHNQ
uniref:CCHC-type domain-containing protein n=1 Tax=Heligmosomoides polygyrus TaxID=6339 RepID=A0A183G4D7_HELPZ